MRILTPQEYLKISYLFNLSMLVTAENATVSNTSDALVSGRRESRSVRKQRYIETLVVVDNTMINYYGSSHVTKYVLTVMNMVSKFYLSYTLTVLTDYTHLLCFISVVREGGGGGRLHNYPG